MLVDNYYTHCIDWTLEDCDSFHNDHCPVCNKEVEPYESLEFTPDGEKRHYHTEGL